MAAAYLKSPEKGKADTVWMCTKTQYPVKHHATRVVRNFAGSPDVATGKGVVTAYQCRYCGFWHVGHKRR